MGVGREQGLRHESVDLPESVEDEDDHNEGQEGNVKCQKYSN